MARPTAAVSVHQAFTQVYAIDLAGELTSSSDTALLNAYQQVSNEGARVVILNFSDLVYKNSRGAKSLVILLTPVKAAGQRLFAAEMNIEYRNIFRVMQLDQEITVCATVADALQAAHELLGTPGAPLPIRTVRVETAQRPVNRQSVPGPGESRQFGLGPPNYPIALEHYNRAIQLKPSRNKPVRSADRGSLSPKRCRLADSDV